MGLTSNTTSTLAAEHHLRDHDPDLKEEAATKNSQSGGDNEQRPAVCSPKTPLSYRYIPLAMGGSGRTHAVSEESKEMMKHEVSLADLQQMTTRFYELAFEDATLDKFLRSHDDPHGDRFAKWIHQKLSGSNVWDKDRSQRSHQPVELARGLKHVVHDRSSAHAAAWYSPKRPPKDVGRHFQLDECRVWMRLHFWALRETMLDISPTFADYYIRFIGHFVRVYEGTAPAFARESWRWSADPENIRKYLDNGRVMSDVLGLSFEDAEAQLPQNEANDGFWPYYVDETSWVPPQ